MKLKTKYLSCLICTITLYISSCSKLEKLPEVHVAEELMEYFNYQPGSYWVYYDSVNHVLDSIYVFRNYIYSSEEHGKNYIVRVINIENISGHNTSIALKNTQASFGYQFEKVNGSLRTPVFSLVTPFESNYHNIHIGNVIFNQIIAITNSDYPDQKDSLFISKEIGVVKMKFPTTNTNYNLLRYKIVKNETNN